MDGGVVGEISGLLCCVGLAWLAALGVVGLAVFLFRLAWVGAFLGGQKESSISSGHLRRRLIATRIGSS